MSLLKGKTALVVGVANKRSLAWGCVRSFLREGAQVILTYQNERFRDNVEKLVEETGADIPLYPLDVSSNESLESLTTILGAHAPIHTLVHSVAHARAEDLSGEFVDTSREGFSFALDVSAYSLIALTRAVKPHLARDSSIMTMTYHGAVDRVVPNYNVMAVAKSALETSVRYLASTMGPEGVRVNAISSGPVKTLAASGVKGISKMIEVYEQVAPLRRAVTIEEVGDVAAFLASDLSRSISGSIINVDQGFHILGVG